VKTRTPTWQKLILPAGFAMACVVLSLLTWLSFGGSAPLEPRGYRVSLRLPQASNLFNNADVRISGVSVGHVAKVARDRNAARATIELDPEFSPLHAGARAILRTKTLLGETFIEITPGPRTDPRIPEDGSLAPGNVQPAQRLDDVLETFAPGTRANTRKLFAGLAAAFRGRAQDFNDSIGFAQPVAANFDVIARSLDGQRPQLRDLISGSADVLTALARQQGALQAAVTAGNQVLDVTARRDHELAATIRALPPFLDALRTASNTLTGASGEISRAVSALRPVAPLVSPALAQIRASAPTFRTLFRGLPAVISAGRRAAPALTRMLNASRPAFASAYPAARELTPFLQLLGATRSSVIGFFGNVGSTLAPKMVGAGNRIQYYGLGTAKVWNETISGWVKRLPTNRSNAYPKPNSADDIGKIGHLKTYDCRHLGNTLYLPPTGTGAPPCDEQGPWTYRGLTRYFPHLELAPP
jgi:virulence factor Mce-like protein